MRRGSTMKANKRFSLIYGIFLLAFTLFTVLETFVIPQTYQVVAEAATETEVVEQAEYVVEDEDETASETAQITDTSYEADGISIKISTYYEYDTAIYVADILLDDPSDLSTAFAYNTYGKNITDTTSSILETTGGILAINGDYYSARRGYVIRNGVLYSESSAGSDQEDLVIWADGTMEVIKEGDVTAKELLEQGAQQVFCFGPGLIENGEIAVDENDEVSKSMSSNPRTTIGQISDNHYVMVVSDGRTDESRGLSLYELAEFMTSLGCETAYNLDGGGSSTMVFNGTVINKPTTNGNHIKERSVSDIVYIG